MSEKTEEKAWWTVMGKCKFAESWLDMPDFKEWLQPVEGNNKEPYCKICKKRINIVSMGIKALRSHMSCVSHKAAASRRERQLPIAAFCVPPQPSAVTLPPAAAPEPNVTATTSGHSASSFSADIRVALGGTATLRAEVLWCLHTAEKHHSLNSNENLCDRGKNLLVSTTPPRGGGCPRNRTVLTYMCYSPPETLQKTGNTSSYNPDQRLEFKTYTIYYQYRIRRYTIIRRTGPPTQSIGKKRQTKQTK